MRFVKSKHNNDNTNITNINYILTGNLLSLGGDFREGLCTKYIMLIENRQY